MVVGNRRGQRRHRQPTIRPHRCHQRFEIRGMQKRQIPLDIHIDGGAAPASRLQPRDRCRWGGDRRSSSPHLPPALPPPRCVHRRSRRLPRWIPSARQTLRHDPHDHRDSVNLLERLARQPAGSVTRRDDCDDRPGCQSNYLGDAQQGGSRGRWSGKTSCARSVAQRAPFAGPDLSGPDSALFCQAPVAPVTLPRSLCHLLASFTGVLDFSRRAPGSSALPSCTTRVACIT